MRKWTTTSLKGQSEPGSITLNQILAVQGSLNTVECWALLGQTGYALQDILLSLNSRRCLRRAPSITSSSGRCVKSQNRDLLTVTVAPQRVICTATGRVVINTNSANILTDISQYLHPEVSRKTSGEVSDRDLELVGVYSLAQTVYTCLAGADSSQQSLKNLLDGMKRGQISLLVMLQTVSAEWAKLVGESPISQFVAQLCKRTQGWTQGPSTVGLPKPPHIEPKHDDLVAEVEFSRLETNSSSSSSPSASPQPPCKPLCASSPLHSKVPLSSVTQHYGRRLEYRPSRTEPSPKKRRAVERNPSRLYRVVRPLTEISIAPLPATKKCIGPEFIIMSLEDPILLDLYIHRSRKDEGLVKNVTVVMLDGHQLSVRCNAATVTAGEVLDSVLRERDIKESSLFTLSVLGERGQEYWSLASEMKLSKIAPNGWKEGKPCKDLTLYQRFKFHPDDLDNLKNAENKHFMYLQLRQDLLDGRIHGISYNMYLSLAGMALHIEFGDFSDDIHGDGEYFMLEHYLPSHMLYDDRVSSQRSLAKVHRAHIGQSQSKTEMKFCRELMAMDCVGFHYFSVSKDKKSNSSLPLMTNASPNLLGIHVQGVFLYEKAKDHHNSHKLLAPFIWRNIARIQYDKSRFQMTIIGSNNNVEDSKSQKLKFQVSETKAKLMFDLASSHHQHSNKLRYQAKKVETNEPAKDDEETVVVEYKEPPRERAIRSLKNKFLSKRQLTQKKLYTQPMETGSNLRASLKRSKTTNYLVKRLTHYSSMADNLMAEHGVQADLNTSDKENRVENGNYRYKFYLEPEEDKNPQSGSTPIGPTRIPLQERPLASLYPELATPAAKPKIATNPKGWRRRSDTIVRPNRNINEPPAVIMGSVPRKGGQPKCGSILRMGTQISLSVLHRERLRLTSDLGAPPLPQRTITARKLPFSIDDYNTMETKSILPSDPMVLPNLGILEPSVPYPSNESLSTSLIERFDQMETEESEPERQIVSVILRKDEQGRLGLKITGTPSGIYIEDFDPEKVRVEGSNQLKHGDRLVAVNGRSLENVSYANALELVRKSGDSVQFLVSQIKS